MAIISNKLNSFKKYHFIFREKSILLQNGNLPDASTMKKCLELSVASDWISEPELDYTALQLEDDTPNPKECEDIPLREFFARHQNDGENGFRNVGSLAARARGILNFHTNKRFCERCGSPLRDDEKFTARTCTKCGRQFFPQLEPAIIVLVTKDEECLLARHANRISDVWTTLAGFVEMGETIESAVHREIFEEVGIHVKNVRYVASQAWPYPDQLMLAFRAEYESGEIKAQEGEILEAKWFRKDSLPNVPPPGSVAHNLISGVFG
nr:NAD(+) diphosphatase [Treponema sp.]